MPKAYIPARGTEAATPLFPLLYHFTHANILHLIANAAALLYFKPRPSTAVMAFLVASAVALLPFLQLDAPTCGLSAIACAAFARRYVAWHTNPLPFLAFQLLFAFIPNFNFKIHVIAFLTALVIWKILYWSKTDGQ